MSSIGNAGPNRLITSLSNAQSPGSRPPGRPASIVSRVSAGQQPGTDSEKYARLIFGRFLHRCAAMLGKNLSEIAIEAG